jgi:hypothetical protein
LINSKLEQLGINSCLLVALNMIAGKEKPAEAG